MGHLTTGMDLPNRKTPRVEFQPREVKAVNVTAKLPPDMHKDLAEYCEARRISQASLIRLLIAREIWD